MLSNVRCMCCHSCKLCRVNLLIHCQALQSRALFEAFIWLIKQVMYADLNILTDTAAYCTVVLCANASCVQLDLSCSKHSAI